MRLEVILLVYLHSAVEMSFVAFFAVQLFAMSGKERGREERGIEGGRGREGVGRSEVRKVWKREKYYSLLGIKFLHQFFRNVVFFHLLKNLI